MLDSGGEKRRSRLSYWCYLRGIYTQEKCNSVRADCLATTTEECDRCTHAATQATNVAQIKTEGTKGLLIVLGGWVRVQ
jgi:hypothetical protein